MKIIVVNNGNNNSENGVNGLYYITPILTPKNNDNNLTTMSNITSTLDNKIKGLFANSTDYISEKNLIQDIVKYIKNSFRVYNSGKQTKTLIKENLYLAQYVIPLFELIDSMMTLKNQSITDGQVSYFANFTDEHKLIINSIGVDLEKVSFGLSDGKALLATKKIIKIMYDSIPVFPFDADKVIKHINESNYTILPKYIYYPETRGELFYLQHPRNNNTVQTDHITATPGLNGTYITVTGILNIKKIDNNFEKTGDNPYTNEFGNENENENVTSKKYFLKRTFLG